MLHIYESLQLKYFQLFERKKYKYLHPTAVLPYDAQVWNKDLLVMDEKTNIGPKSMIMNAKAKFVMKHHSGAAFGLTVVTGSHPKKVDRLLKTVRPEEQAEIDAQHKLDNDVVVEEEVWIGANVTLLNGATIGRGAVIGAGAVVRNNIPPYAIAIGNPARVVGFKFNVEEILEHESLLYPENERIAEEVIRNNYKKYFINRLKEIRQLTFA